MNPVVAWCDFSLSWISVLCKVTASSVTKIPILVPECGPFLCQIKKINLLPETLEKE